MLLTGPLFADVLQYKITQAKHSIKMIVFCWTIWEEKKCNALFKINNALRYAARQGVQIQCITGSEGLTRKIAEMGFDAKCLTKFKIIHAKFILIDSKMLFLGSHNLTKSGLESNLEISTIINFDETNNDANNFFNGLWNY